MEIVINILDEAYEAIKQAALTARDRNYGYLAIANGKVLPKGHGRLIDADAFIKAECSRCDGYCDVCDCDCLNCKFEHRCEFIKDIDSADVIVEAETEADE